MKNRSIRIKLFGLLMLPIILFFIPTIVLRAQVFNRFLGNYDELTQEEIPRIQALEELQFEGARMISSVNEYALDGFIENTAAEETPNEEFDAGERKDVLQAIASFKAAYDEYIARKQVADTETLAALDDAVEEMIFEANELVEFIESEQFSTLELLQEERAEYEEVEEEFLAAVAMALEAENKAVGQNESEVSDIISFIETMTLIMPFLIITMTFGGGFLLIRAILGPIQSLTQAAQSLAEGNFDARATIYSSDEIGKLANTFNFMAEVIQLREKELTEYNRRLEERVKERTAELKEARDKALAAQRIAQENSRLKSEFLSTMSHELRTPLNAIEGFTSIMLSGMGVELSPRAEDMVKRIASNSKRLLQLINDFLDLSRIESGRLELVDAPVALRDLARRWENDISILAEEKGLEFTVHIDPELPATILTDEDALHKIVTNLLSNAIKFTKQGSVKLGLQKMQNDEWAVVVSDTGIGIPPHAREYIFEEFRQVDGSSKREYGGTGLGLALVQKLTRAMNGRVLLDSELGEGSTFTVILPLRTPVETLEGVTNNE